MKRLKPTTTMTTCASQFDNLDLPEMIACLASIPGHNPERYETSDELQDSSWTNGDRSALAAKALDCFRKSCPADEDLGIASTDLICDLLHLAHANGSNLQNILREVIHNFLCEAGELPSTLETV